MEDGAEQEDRDEGWQLAGGSQIATKTGGKTEKDNLHAV